MRRPRSPYLSPRCLALLLTLSLAAQPARPADWPQLMRSSEHTGDAAGETLKLPLGLATCVQLGDAITTGPAIVGGKVYVVDQMGTAYCVDPAANRVVWQAAPDGKDARAGNSSSACVARGRVYFGTTAGRLHVLDAGTGKLVRSFDAGWPITGSPTLANDSIYFQTVGAAGQGSRHSHWPGYQRRRHAGIVLTWAALQQKAQSPGPRRLTWKRTGDQVR